MLANQPNAPSLVFVLAVALVALLTHSCVFFSLLCFALIRLITSFIAADPFENDGVEWVRLTVNGQSFMMHQIRKMVSVVLCQLLFCLLKPSSRTPSPLWWRY